MATSAVRLFVPDHPALPNTIRGRLEQRRAELIEQVGAGMACDWADYRLRTGVIRGLEQAISMSVAVEKELNRD